MNLLKQLARIWTLKDLRNRILLTIAIILIFRALAHLPLPGVDLEGLKSFFTGNQVLGALDLLTGGSVGRFSLVMLGVGPYITASIVVQLMQSVVPAWDALSKEGEYGKQKLNQYTRYLTLPLAFFEGFGLLRLLQSQGVIQFSNLYQMLFILLIAAAGSMFLLWLAELISERGIGNGPSIIITIGIVAGLPSQVLNTIQVYDPSMLPTIIAVSAVALLIVGLIVTITEAERRVPVRYARRIRGQANISQVESYLPIKVNAAGVIPIIFASSVLIVPQVASQFLAISKNEKIREFSSLLLRYVNNQLYYVITLAVLVVAFTFFYTGIILQPSKIAENLQKQNGFIPGYRPGRETGQYLGKLIMQITLFGALFLALIAISPNLMKDLSSLTTIALGGTSVLIIVSVILDTGRQINAQLLTRTYDRFA